MNLPEVVTREEWLDAAEETADPGKELTRQRDALNADRRRLPMVAIEKDYVFQGPDGPVGLADLFDGCTQLIVRHAMYDPDWEKACPSCTATMDEMAPALFAHLRTRDTAYAAISPAPYPKLAAYRAEYGWTFPWYSSFESDFNYDFGVTLDPAVTPVVFNYRSHAELIALIRPGPTTPQARWVGSAASCGSGTMSFTRTPRSAAVARKSTWTSTGAWTSRPWAARRTGRSRRVGPPRPGRPLQSSPDGGGRRPGSAERPGRGAIGHVLAPTETLWCACQRSRSGFFGR